MFKSSLLSLLLLLLSFACNAEPRGTGDLGIAIEREQGSALIINTTSRSVLARIDSLGDLSDASVVFSRDQRYAFIFGRHEVLVTGKRQWHLLYLPHTSDGAIIPC